MEHFPGFTNMFTGITDTVSKIVGASERMDLVEHSPSYADGLQKKRGIGEPI
jgi:hypothetical protein